ncbi:MAG: urease subunit alpha [Dehalococcoidia bacterium]|nr:urease subunit alpha [Dehalococcoidia bacterium]
MPFQVSRHQYSLVHGPTTGDRIRLADTSLILEIEADHAEYGDEVVSGWAKNHREGMMINARASDSELDLVLVGVIVVDPVLGVFKGSIGIKDGRIVGIGNAGNPDISDNVDLVIGPGTNVMGGGSLIATPGGVDSHVHFITPRLIPVALEGGVTTLIGAGLGHQPARNLEIPLAAVETFPVNIGFQARASSHHTDAIERYISAGACGFKVHEDMGAYAPIIDAALTVADQMDVSVCLHTDGLNEAVEVSETIDAMRGRTVHAYHVEGAGGGHTPDALMMATRDHIIASSTTPTVPYGVGAPLEHIDMMSIMHGQNYGLEENVEAVRLRIRSASMEAEDLLHEMGAISIINSDSQGMGRIQETVRRTWQLANANKVRALATGDAAQGRNDNTRILQYLAKYTINPAITHGIARYVGSLEPGKIADIVLWEPRFFGVKPSQVIKGGHVAWGPLGNGNASASGAQPVVYGPTWGGLGRAVDRLAVNFVADAAIEAGVKARIKSEREFLPVRGARGLSKRDLILNTASPSLDIDAMTGEVRADGVLLACAPLESVPMGRKYLLS